MAIAPQPRGVIELDRTPLFHNTQQLLRRAEAEIRLIDRAQPTNAIPEREALIVDYGAGRARAPNFRYDAAACARRACVRRFRLRPRPSAVWARWGPRTRPARSSFCAKREAAEQVGTAQFAACCARRYPLESSLDADAADAWAARWIQAPDVAQTVLHRSDDRADPGELDLRAGARCRGLAGACADPQSGCCRLGRGGLRRSARRALAQP